MKRRFFTVLSERFMRRATLMLTAAVLTILASCKGDELQRTQLTEQEVTTYCKAIAGNYGGSYSILWSDESMPWHKNEDGTTSREMVRETKEGVSVTVTDRDMRSIVFHNFPISMVSRVVVGDDALKAALKDAPDMDLTSRYNFTLNIANEQPVLLLGDMTVPLTLNYNGQEHHVLLNFKTGTGYVLDKTKQTSDLGFDLVRGISFRLDSFQVDGGTTHSQVLWVDDVRLNVIFQKE